MYRTHVLAFAIDWKSLNQEYPRWIIERHSHAPKAVKEIVLTMTMIRSIASWSSISLLPNELLFLIFEHLDIDAILRLYHQQRTQEYRGVQQQMVEQERRERAEREEQQEAGEMLAERQRVLEDVHALLSKRKRSRCLLS